MRAYECENCENPIKMRIDTMRQQQRFAQLFFIGFFKSKNYIHANMSIL